MAKKIECDYDKNINELFNIVVNDNEDLVKYIENITYYKQGEWKKDKQNRPKRTDIAIIKVDNIPSEIITLISLFMEKDNMMPIKYKIKILKRTETTINLKIKFNLINKLANLIFKLVRLKVNLEINGYDNNTKTKVIVYYKIKSILTKNLNNTVDDFITNKLLPEYIGKMNTYIKTMQ